MTNTQIILEKSIELMAAGILKPTNKMMAYVTPDGAQIEIPVPEQIHTYSTWKEHGYQVKKGQHAKASFPVWKFISKKGEEDTEEDGEKAKGRCYMKNAFWFTFDQVEKIA